MRRLDLAAIILSTAALIGVVAAPVFAGGWGGGGGGAAGITQGYLVGCSISFSGDATVIVQPGVARDKDDAATITVTSSITLTDANQAFDAATGGGLDTGASLSANTWYYAHLTNHATPSVLLSTSVSAPTLPSGVTATRWVGVCRSDASSDWFQCEQSGGPSVRLSRYRNEDTNVGTRVLNAGASTTYADVDVSAHIPPEAFGVKVWVIQNGANFATNNAYGQSVDHNRILNPGAATGGREFAWDYIDTDNQQSYRYRVGGVSTTQRLLGYEFRPDGSE